MFLRTGKLPQIADDRSFDVHGRHGRKTLVFEPPERAAGTRAVKTSKSIAVTKRELPNPCTAAIGKMDRICSAHVTHPPQH
jgi:hypothetical protein